MFTTQLRLKENTADKIKIIAEEKERSLNSQIEYILKEYIKDYEKINGKIELPQEESEDRFKIKRDYKL